MTVSHNYGTEYNVVSNQTVMAYSDLTRQHQIDDVGIV